MAKSYFYDENISDWRELVKGERGEDGATIIVNDETAQRAEAAQTGAETARTGAETAETNAEHSADRAEIAAFNTPQIVVSDEAPETTEHNGIWYDFKPGAVTYAWAGEPHNSESIKYVDGVEVARNIWADTLLSESGSGGKIEFVEDGVIVSEGAANLLIPTTDNAPPISDANGRNFSASYKVKNLGDFLLQIRVRIYDGTEYTADSAYYTISPGETEIVKIEGVVPTGNYVQARIHANTLPERNNAHISQPMWQWADSVESYFDGDTIGTAVADTTVIHNGQATRVIEPPQPIHPTPDDIERISEGLGLRVDTSAGTRVFVGDTMIHGDTDWLDVTNWLEAEDVISGTALIRRENNTVTIRFSSLELRPGTGFRHILRIQNGNFRPTSTSEYVQGGIFRSSNAINQNIVTVYGSLVYWAKEISTNSVSQNVPNVELNGAVSFGVRSSFPQPPYI